MSNEGHTSIKDYVTYVARAQEAIEQCRDGIRESAFCPECNEHVLGADGAHVVYPESPGHGVVVIVGCENAWLIDPNELQIANPNWTDENGELSCTVEEYAGTLSSFWAGAPDLDEKVAFAMEELKAGQVERVEDFQGFLDHGRMYAE